MGGHPLSPPGGPSFLVSFSLENCDQSSGSVVSIMQVIFRFTSATPW